MQLRLLTTSLLLMVAAATSCTEHSGTNIAAPQNNPDPPINGGDGDVFVPPIADIDPNDGGVGDGGLGGDGGNNSPDGGSGNGGSGGGDSGQSNGGGGGGGGSPGAAVPEPGTMLLVGSGLAGLAYYRRRKNPEVESED